MLDSVQEPIPLFYSANPDGDGIVLFYEIVMVLSEGMKKNSIISKLQLMIDNEQLLYHQPTYVTKFEVTGGGCQIGFKTGKLSFYYSFAYGGCHESILMVIS